jgi:hypothetical protein
VPDFRRWLGGACEHEDTLVVDFTQIGNFAVELFRCGRDRFRKIQADSQHIDVGFLEEFLQAQIKSCRLHSLQVFDVEGISQQCWLVETFG